MGCIEIMVLLVLIMEMVQINRNMGCIEICDMEGNFIQKFKINRNMGCIEIIEDLLKAGQRQ